MKIKKQREAKGDDTFTFKFKMLDGVLQSIELSGVEVEQYISSNGTYKPASNPDPKKKSSKESSSLFTGTWNNPVSNGSWTLDANGIWHYATTASFRNTWGYIENPYAKPGQHEADWFYFDNAGNMLTGWQFIQGKWYYLNPTKDGTLGACQIGGVTPDGHRVDENGAWDGKGKAPVATGGKTVFTGTAGNPVVDGNGKKKNKNK